MSKQVVEFYVVIRDRNHNKRYHTNWLALAAERVTQSKPRLANGEVAVKVRLSVSEEQFREFIPTVEADIEDRMMAAPEAEVLTPDPEPA